jgi:hypothetical protein
MMNESDISMSNNLSESLQGGFLSIFDRRAEISQEEKENPMFRFSEEKRFPAWEMLIVNDLFREPMVKAAYDHLRNGILCDGIVIKQNKSTFTLEQQKVFDQKYMRQKFQTFLNEALEHEVKYGFVIVTWRRSYTPDGFNGYPVCIHPNLINLYFRYNECNEVKFRVESRLHQQNPTVAAENTNKRVYKVFTSGTFNVNGRLNSIMGSIINDFYFSSLLKRACVGILARHVQPCYIVSKVSKTVGDFSNKTLDSVLQETRPFNDADDPNNPYQRLSMDNSDYANIVGFMRNRSLNTSDFLKSLDMEKTNANMMQEPLPNMYKLQEDETIQRQPLPTVNSLALDQEKILTERIHTIFGLPILRTLTENGRAIPVESSDTGKKKESDTLHQHGKFLTDVTQWVYKMINKEHDMKEIESTLSEEYKQLKANNEKAPSEERKTKKRKAAESSNAGGGVGDTKTETSDRKTDDKKSVTECDVYSLENQFNVDVLFPAIMQLDDIKYAYEQGLMKHKAYRELLSIKTRIPLQYLSEEPEAPPGVFYETESKKQLLLCDSKRKKQKQ